MKEAEANRETIVHNDVMTVLGFGGEAYPVVVQGFAGSQMKVSTDGLDFGTINSRADNVKKEEFRNNK